MQVKNSLDERFEQHEELNQKIWEEDKTLKQDVEEVLLNMIEQYVEDSELLKPSDIITAQIVGSNASYNYTDDSDLDLHLMVNMSDICCDPIVAQIANDGEKSLFNDRYDLEINGVNVELYVQDVNTAAVSNGVYDLYNSEWVKIPSLLEADIDYDQYDKLYKEKQEVAQTLAQQGSREEIKQFIDNLYIERAKSLQQDGEAGNLNQVFKDLRADGLIKQLRDRMRELRSQELSLYN